MIQILHISILYYFDNSYRILDKKDPGYNQWSKYLNKTDNYLLCHSLNISFCKKFADRWSLLSGIHFEQRALIQKKDQTLFGNPVTNIH